jgi:hypothetical protein
MYDNFRCDLKVKSGFEEIFKGEDVVLGEKTNPLVKDEKNVFNLYNPEPLPVEYMNLTVFDTLVNYYNICIQGYENNIVLIEVWKKSPTVLTIGSKIVAVDSLYQDSIKNWNKENYHKYTCNSRYLQTVMNHTERYRKVVLSKCEYDQKYEVVINDKLSYFNSVRIYIVNGKLSSETTLELKKSYKEFLSWKSENCD